MYVRRCISTGKLIPHYVISARSAKFKSRLPARLDRFWRLVLVRGVFSFTNLRLGIENSASKMKPECPFNFQLQGFEMSPDLVNARAESLGHNLIISIMHFSSASCEVYSACIDKRRQDK